MDKINSYTLWTFRILIVWLEVRVLLGSQPEPLNDVERFLSSIQFDARENAQDLIEKGGI